MAALTPAALVYLVHMRRPWLGDKILRSKPHVLRVGFEPTSHGLKVRRSTAELPEPALFSRYLFAHDCLLCRCLQGLQPLHLHPLHPV